MYCTGRDEVAQSFPPAFVSFLQTNDIHPDNYAVADVPRYVRISPRAPAELDHAELERQLGTSVQPVKWFPGYFQVPSQVKIARCPAYRDGHLYGIDVSSGAAVAALEVQEGDDVLDLCCAPGAKLCALADALQLSGTLTGVDVSEERLAACRTLCVKYGVTNVRTAWPCHRCHACVCKQRPTVCPRCLPAPGRGCRAHTGAGMQITAAFNLATPHVASAALEACLRRRDCCFKTDGS